MNKQRMDWIDAAKGIGIILVMFGHLQKSWYIYSFHVPLFFILSGFTHSTYSLSVSQFVRRKLNSLVVPYFALGAVMVAFDAIMNTYGNHARAGYDFRNQVIEFIVQKRLWTLWFLSSLFVLSILFQLLLVLFKERIWFLVAVVVVLPIGGLIYYGSGGEAVVWNADASIMALPFYGFGYLLRTFKVHDAFFGRPRKFQFLVFLGLGILNVGLTALNIKLTGEGLEMCGSKYGIAPITYAAAMAGSLATCILAGSVRSKGLVYVGRNSIIYFAWHQTIAMMLLFYAYHKLSIFQGEHLGFLMQIAKDATTWIGMVILLTLACEIIRKLRLNAFTGATRF